MHAKLLEDQVGGHPGIMRTEDDSLIIKPTNESEVHFYNLIAEDYRLSELRPFVPKFYGTLKLQGKMGEDGQLEDVDTEVLAPGVKVDGVRPESIVIENVIRGLDKPNIMDIKLGTELYDKDAPPEKRQRAIQSAHKSTSEKTGVRLTAFQVYDYTAAAPDKTSKDYGRSITPEQLPEGMRKFFPVSSTPDPFQDNLEAVYDGKPEGLGLPASLLRPILTAILERVRTIRNVVAKIETRMVATSVLIGYEGDWNKAREGVLAMREGVKRTPSDAMEEDEDEDEESDEEDNEPSLPFVIKVIDFAHSSMVPGEGPDESVLVGYDTTISLLEGRLREISDL